MGKILKNISINKSLSARLLVFTIFFVLLAEIVVYVPSIANFRKNWIEEKLAEANIAILVIEAAPDYMVSRMLADELLTSTETYSIVRYVSEENMQSLNVMDTFKIFASYDMRDLSWWTSVKDAFKTLTVMHEEGYLVEVTGYSNIEGDEKISIVFDEILLCHDMLIYSRNIVLLTIIISLMTATLIYYSLSNLMVRPIQNITENMIAFRKAPEDYTNQYKPESREDEIGVVMRELAIMQDDIRKALNQKNHLAKLGGAISNINHDLRNMLASAQLVSDHLSTIENPIVQKLAPRFVKAIDRAIRLCENTLQYGGATPEVPNIKSFNLHEMVDDVATSLGLFEKSTIELKNNIKANQQIEADNDLIFRVFMNICRNAVHAMGDSGTIIVNSTLKKKKILIDISDTGPGIPEKIKANLFQPFKSGSNGGSGLGLAISREIVKAHGGNIDLLSTGSTGTEFRIELPI